MISVGHDTCLRQFAHVDAGELLEEPHRVVGRRGAALQMVERLPVRAGAVGQELRGEHLPERRIVAAPADPREIEIQCGGASLLVVDGAHRAPPRVRRAQHRACVTRSG